LILTDLPVLHDVQLLRNHLLVLSLDRHGHLPYPGSRRWTSHRSYRSVGQAAKLSLTDSSGLFGIFCTMMLIQHFYLIVTGKSTVEAFAGRDQVERETRHLNVVFGFWSHNKEKRLVKDQWEDEFGHTAVDDRWRAGTMMSLWRTEMGPKWYHWICTSSLPFLDEALLTGNSSSWSSSGRRRTLPFKSEVRT
jgi:hypothetical protein